MAEPVKWLIIMVGLPRSGKSTLAKYLNCPVVSRDAIRKTMGWYPFREDKELQVSIYEELMVRSLFNAGHRVVVLDACHVQKRQRNRWASNEWKRVFYVVNTDPAECRRRAIEKGQDYLVPVILRMSRQYQPVTEHERKAG